MVVFLDGPAAGETLMLRRIPILLRVVRNSGGGLAWDALDQLDDTPDDYEEIFVYRRRDDLEITKYHLSMTRRSSSGWYFNASYSYEANQPRDDEARSTEAWRAWATAHAIADPLL